MDVSEIRATEALTYDAEDSINAGLADRVGALEEEMIVFAEDISVGDEQMADTNTDKGIPQATHDKAVADASASGKIAGAADAKARIVAIFGCDEAKARPKAAMSAALKTDMSVEQAKAFLADLPEEKAEAPKAETPEAEKPKSKRNHFEEAMRNTDPKVDAGGDEDGDTAGDMASSILRDYAGVTGGVERKKVA